MKRMAEAWYEHARAYVGLIWWPRRYYETMSPGDFVNAFEELAAQSDPFSAYPIIHLKPGSQYAKPGLT